MGKVIISFPGIGIEPFAVNKIAFTIPIGKGIDVAWYGIILTLGIVAGVGYAIYRTRTEKEITSEDIMDYALWTVIIAILGARTYYVLTTLDSHSYDSFYDVIAIWNGGIAIYGAIIGGASALLLVSKLKKFGKDKTLRVFDMVSPGVMLGQIIGRWGNFMNGEAHGSRIYNNFFLRMGLGGGADLDPGLRNEITYYHPTFLYESLWNLIGFVLINLFYKKKKYDGQITLMYLAWYGFGRMFIEGLRTDSLYIGPFRISQVVGFLCFAICTALLIYFEVRARRNCLEKADYVPVYEQLHSSTEQGNDSAEKDMINENNAAESGEKE